MQRVEERPRAVPGQGCCGGGSGFFHQLLVLSSLDIDLRLHPLPPLPPPSCRPSVSVSKSRLCPPLGCVWLVTSSFPKWLVLHEVSVCMTCWVSVLFLFVLFYNLVSSLFFFYNCTYDFGRDYGTLVLGQRLYGKAVTHMLLFKESYCSSFPICCFRCTECGFHSSSSALFRSESEKWEPFRVTVSWSYIFFSTARVCEQTTYHSVCSDIFI